MSRARTLYFERLWGRLGRGEAQEGDSLDGLLRRFCQCLSFQVVGSENHGPGCCSMRVAPGLPFFEDDAAVLFAVRQTAGDDGDELYSVMGLLVYSLGLDEVPVPVLVLRMQPALEQRCASSAVKFVLLPYREAVRVYDSGHPRAELERVIEGRRAADEGCPFVTAGAVGSDLFYGREAEIKRIAQPRGSGSDVVIGRSYAVIGPRKAGKTSLLYKLKRVIETACPGVAAHYLTLKSCANARQAMAKVVSRANPRRLGKLTAGEFERIMARAHGEADDCVWLLDECDRAIEDDLRTGERFCRALASSPHNRAVFAGHSQLRRASLTQASEYWNAVAKLDLYGLDTASAKNLFQDTFRRRGWEIRPKQARQVLAHVVEGSHCMPALVQLYGAATWQVARERGRREVTLEDVCAAESTLAFREQTVEALVQDANPLARLIVLLLDREPGQAMLELQVHHAVQRAGVARALPEVLEALNYLELVGLLTLEGGVYRFAYAAFPRLLHSCHEPEFLLDQTLRTLRGRR